MVSGLVGLGWELEGTFLTASWDGDATSPLI